MPGISWLLEPLMTAAAYVATFFVAEDSAEIESTGAKSDLDGRFSISAPGRSGWLEPESETYEAVLQGTIASSESPSRIRSLSTAEILLMRRIQPSELTTTCVFSRTM